VSTDPITSPVEASNALSRIAGEDRFLIQQVFKPIANEYRISIPAEGSTEEGEQVVYVRQKKMKIKEDIRFRAPGVEDEHLFMIKSKTVFEFRGRHEVLDANGEKIGTLGKQFGKSLLRSQWIVTDAQDQVVIEGRESSFIIGLLRRMGEVIGDWLFFLEYLPFNFTIYKGDPDHELGDYQRVLGKLRDKYVLELSPELDGVDRRLLIAFAVALDALQDR
jgi:uncharacterized protein YxjI